MELKGPFFYSKVSPMFQVTVELEEGGEGLAGRVGGWGSDPKLRQERKKNRGQTVKRVQSIFVSVQGRPGRL